MKYLFILICLFLCSCSRSIDLSMVYDEVKDQLPTLIEANEDDLEEIYDLDMEDIKQFVVYRPLSTVESDEFILIQAHENEVQDIKEDLDVYFNMMESYWKDVLPLQYEKIINRKEMIIEDYYCVVVNEHANEIITKVMEQLKA